MKRLTYLENEVNGIFHANAQESGHQRLLHPGSGGGGGGGVREDRTLPPRLGGAVLYAGSPLAREGHLVTPLGRIGGDSAGARYLEAARGKGLDTAGFALDASAETARCLMVYRDEDLCDCVMDRDNEPLTPTQIGLAGRADLLMVTAAGAEASRQMLDAAPKGALVAWLAKNDEICFPADLRERLRERADVIFCTRAERPFIDAAGRLARRGQIVFETRGAEGGVVVGPKGEHAFTAMPVDVDDATGAGDTFAGAVLAALLEGSGAETAAARGTDAAHAFLLERAAHG